MEFIVQKIGMSRIVDSPSYAVTLLKLVNTKVCEVNGNSAIVACSKGRSLNKPMAGQQKKYNLSKEFNNFATLKVANIESGDIDTSSISSGVVVQASFNTKGRGFSGVMKRWNFAGGPAAHGSRFHRRTGSIGNREWPGRVQKGKKMAGQYGNELVSVRSSIVSFDKESGVIVLKGSVSGFNGAYGRISILDKKGAK